MTQRHGLAADDEADALTVVRVSGTVIWLTALWVLLWGTLTVANIAGGLVIALGVLAVARQTSITRVDPEHAARIRPVAIAYLGAYVFYKLVEANLLLAWEIITPRNTIHTGVIAVALRTESETTTMLVATIITLTPGTITIEARRTPAVLYVNVLHLNDIDRVRRDLVRIEGLCVRAFGSRHARTQLEPRTTP